MSRLMSKYRLHVQVHINGGWRDEIWEKEADEPFEAIDSNPLVLSHTKNGETEEHLFVCAGLDGDAAVYAPYGCFERHAFYKGLPHWGYQKVQSVFVTFESFAISVADLNLNRG